MLCISGNDIEQAISLKETINAVESALILQESGDFLMPNRVHLNIDKNCLLLMPCFIKDKFSTKLVSVFPDNLSKNKPVIYGTVVLNDGETGEPLALINGGKLTAMRTAAVGAVGAKYLSDKNASRLGIIGTGIQGLHLALCVCEERPITNIEVFDLDKDKAHKFIKKLRSFLPDIKINLALTNEELVKTSDIIAAATTSSKPVIPNDENLLKGKTFIGIGSYKPNMQEFPKDLFNMIDQCFIDTEYGLKETGDLINPIENGWLQKEQMYTLGKLINGEIELSENKTRLFKSVGMALFDLVVGNLIYENAIKKGIGTKVEL